MVAILYYAGDFHPLLFAGFYRRFRTVPFSRPLFHLELVDISTKQVVKAIDRLNSRPRKCLKFKTHYEVFEKLTGVNVEKLMCYALIT